MTLCLAMSQTETLAARNQIVSIFSAEKTLLDPDRVWGKKHYFVKAWQSIETGMVFLLAARTHHGNVGNQLGPI